jgi:hypothetical protein
MSCQWWALRLTYVQVHEWMAQANLVILVAVLSVLIVLSIFLQKRRKFVWHGNTMLVVVMIATLLTVAHMGPSFVRVVSETLESFNVVALMGVVHGVVGLATISVGAWLVGMWALGESGETRFCAPRRRLMLIILILWIIALGLGIAYYPLHLILS